MLMMMMMMTLVVMVMMMAMMMMATMTTVFLQATNAGQNEQIFLYGNCYLYLSVILNNHYY
jgi:hypothetical protein